MPINPHHKLLRRCRDLVVAHLLFKRLIEANVDPAEVAVTRRNDGFLLTLSDGTRLVSTSTPDPRLREVLSRRYALPEGGEIALYDYVLRYQYPHFDPSRRPESPPGMRFALEFAMHLQHRNTFWSLGSALRSRLTRTFALREGDQVLEAGPYLGFGTVRMSHSVGRSGRVVALEAGEDTHKVLLENLALNSLSNVSAHYGAMGASDGEMSIARQCDQRISLVEGVVDARSSTVVPTRSIESLCRQEDLEPTFITLTINGAELMAIEGSSDFLRERTGLRLIAPGWYRDEHGAVGPRIARRLEALGFEVITTRDCLVFAWK